jgi:hypothetical protein
VSRARPTWATDKWARPYFIILSIFNQPNFEIRIGVLLDLQNSPNFAGRHFETQGATLIVSPTSKSHCIASYKFWNQFKFEYSLNLRGVQTFLEKSDKFYKIPS